MLIPGLYARPSTSRGFFPKDHRESSCSCGEILGMPARDVLASVGHGDEQRAARTIGAQDHRVCNPQVSERCILAFNRN